ncbi:MAG: PadR family transcriptional regulator [Pseudomonadota bacterium]
MSLPHALLTALIERPGSGLELAGRFNKSIGYFWPATHQQIYRELAKLERDGLIQSQAEAEARGRKRTYHVLPEGRQELRRWIEQEDAPPPLRDALLVRLRAEAAVGSMSLDRALRRRRSDHQSRLTNYLSIEERDFGDGPQDKSAALQHLILQTGIRHEATWIEILTQALDILHREQ